MQNYALIKYVQGIDHISFRICQKIQWLIIGSMESILKQGNSKANLI